MAREKYGMPDSFRFADELLREVGINTGCVRKRYPTHQARERLRHELSHESLQPGETEYIAFRGRVPYSFRRPEELKGFLQDNGEDCTVVFVRVRTPSGQSVDVYMGTFPDFGYDNPGTVRDYEDSLG